jgi:hypothetical protein
MRLADLLNEEVSEQISATSEPSASSTITSKDEVEKLASLLDAMSEEDTLIDDLAKLAVVADLLDGGKR